ncbi:inovirus-type Gp2 protein [Burkholderia pseudomallei]|uniref:inovirus-type Gp2 protein n=1 Tax=Burkholderia pseudomallei TaxID=28450 RepID=UPI000F083387|nr:inovirus-type Gp2 protein [Burkholderia pseudomallei]MBF3650905.1 inovirus-type Gp2 protein [Burkholderia pseudomallei]MBF3668915.1 inovirus-type Gp2 protein [Burkholderia pseudomallei]MBF3774372.1 inovirus-type Gp2 protein [Burkholderia pseudomallei]MBF3873408.1 inovirus-type Gp2 protein [Burkholderia pseudomallei]MBF3907679.1 inovirus-type Gp2 protein [Burkholderia pseudomallei]
MVEKFGIVEGISGLLLEEQVDASSLERERNMRGWEPGEYQELYNGLVEFMVSVLSAGHVPYEIRYDRGIKYAVATRPTLTRHLKWCHAYMDLCWPDRYYSADFQLYFDCYRTIPLWHGKAEASFHDPNQHFPDGSILAERFNAFVAYLREQAQARGVAKKLSDWRRGLGDQEESITEYLDELFAANPDIVGQRADLGFVKTAAVESDALPRKSWQVAASGQWSQVSSKERPSSAGWETSARIDPAVAMRFRELFFENRRGADRELFEHLVGYIAKVEQGETHGAFHIHVIFLFNAKRLKSLERMRLLAQERWKRVTNGLGIVFDCHAPDYEARLRRKGLWSLDPVLDGNAQQFEKLKAYVLWYFTKDDGQLVRIKPAAKSRTLTTGQASGRDMK